MSNGEKRGRTNNNYEPEDVKKFVEHAKEFYKRIRNSRVTQVIGFRVPYVVKVKYDVLSPELKYAIRKTVIKLVESAFEGEKSDEKNININVNMNIVKAEAKAEAKPQITINVNTELVEVVEKLQEIIQWLQKIRVVSPEYRGIAKMAINRIEPVYQKLQTLIARN